MLAKDLVEICNRNIKTGVGMKYVWVETHMCKHKKKQQNTGLKEPPGSTNYQHCSQNTVPKTPFPAVTLYFCKDHKDCCVLVRSTSICEGKT